MNYLNHQKNISAAIRWLFRKREILHKRLGKAPNWVETIVEYKGLGKQVKHKGKEATRIINNFSEKYRRYQ